MDIWNWINKDVCKNENPRRFNKCWAEYQAKTGRRLA